MRLLEEYDNKDVLDAYQSFLEIAPKDYPYFPQTYYAMAVCLIDKNILIEIVTNGKINLFKEKVFLQRREKIIFIYEKGLEAEKYQLPFFLLYKSKHKSLLELIFKHCEIQRQQNKKISPFFSLDTFQEDVIRGQNHYQGMAGFKQDKRIQMSANQKSAYKLN
jgi:hypothetical protein